MNKTRIIIVAFMSCLTATAAFSGLTLAWINYQKAITGVQIDSGELKLSNISSRVIRYEYPTFSGSDLIDYSATGSVVSHTLTTSSYTYSLNKLDPTYILITNSGSSSQTAISNLKCNIVVAISFDVTYSVPISFSLSLDKDSSYSSYYDNDNLIQHYGISNYLNFSNLSKSGLDSMSTPSGASTDDEITYYKMKEHSLEDGASTSMGSSDTSFSLFASSITEHPNSEVTTSFSYFVNMDYDLTKCASFFLPANLGKDYSLDCDYSLTLHAKEL